MRKLGITMTCITAALVLCAVLFGWILGKPATYGNADGSFRHITARDSFASVERHPAFSDFSSFIQPWKDALNQTVTPRLSMEFVCLQNRTSISSILDGLNRVVDAQQAGNLTYCDFYTDAERAAEPDKEETGLILLRGKPDMPVAILASGGAFKSVCLFLEGFPVANKLLEQGYNVAVLKYRVNPNAGGDFDTITAEQGPIANEDYARAIHFLFDRQKELGISMDGYSVWGFSAGGRLTSMWGLDNAFGYAANGLPAPQAMILVYSGWYEPQYEGLYKAMPPTYFAYLPDDDVIGAEYAVRIPAFIDYLDRQGTPTAFDTYYTAKHGFGEGRGTDAEGWINHAVAFWLAQGVS